MSCIHCSSFNERENHYDKNAYLPSDVVRSTIHDFVGLGGRTVVFSGGEPLLHPDLLGLIKYATELGVEVRLFSSGLVGLLPTELSEMTQDLASTLRTAGLRRIDFNVQGANPETHERITRTKGSFDLVLRSMANAKAVGLLVGVHFVPMRENYKEFEKVATLVRDMNLDGVAILRFVPQGRGSHFRKRLELTPREFFQLLANVAQFRRGANVPAIRTGCPMNFVTLTEPEREPVKCGAGKTTSVVLANGNVVPCAAFKMAEDMVAGNVLTGTFREVWSEAGVFKAVREFDHDSAGGSCPECSKLAVKEGLCHAQRYAQSGSIYKGHDPHCPTLLQIKRTVDANSVDGER